MWVPDALLLGRSTHPHPVQAGACFSPPILPTLRAFLFRSIHCWPSWEGLAQPARSRSLGTCFFSQLPPPACTPQSSSRPNMPGGERGGRQHSRHFRVSEQETEIETWWKNMILFCFGIGSYYFLWLPQRDTPSLNLKSNHFPVFENPKGMCTLWPAFLLLMKI